MWHYRPVEPFADRPDGYLDGGHFWIREFVTGGVFAVRMDESGLLVMAGPEGDFETPEPWPYRRATDAVRENLDRDGLRAAVDDVTQYTFYVLAPLSMGVEYDWDAMPPVFGLEVWDETADSVLPVDVADRVYEELGLWPIPTVEREVHARDISGDRDRIPEATYGSTTAAGIELRKKRGQSVAVLQRQFESVTRVPPEPAGTPQAFESWLPQELTAETVADLLENGARPLEGWTLEEQSRELSLELARRRFDEVGHLALSDPDRFESAITDRLVTFRHTAVE
ncbi:MAG: hypothetical protein U5K70_09710 [Halodesulfurarchaeum sp.]|nr:hypothetical protein [Halodesulfurarchaeum sp.]